MFERGVDSHAQMLEVMTRLAHAALPAWGVVPAQMALVKFRENAVFKVLGQDGLAWAIRIHRGGYHSDAALRSELQWMTALQAAGVAVPVVVPTVDGELFIKVQVTGLRQPLQVDLFEWIDGRPIGSSEKGVDQDPASVAAIYRTIGNIAARLHNQSCAWPRPPGFTRPAWDGEGLVGESPFWGRFWELQALSPAQRELILAARAKVAEELTALSALPGREQHYGLIHADFVPDNLLVVNGEVRLLDFDDAGFGWHLFELATALYFIQDNPHFALARESLVAGYREHRALPQAMLDKLPVFMMARGFTYLGWVHTRQESAEGRALAPYLVQLACGMAQRFVTASVH